MMFWSENARQFFMGDSTPPYKDVVASAEGARLSLLCGTPEIVKEANDMESICVAFTSFINKCFGRNAVSADDCVTTYIDSGGAALAQKDYEELKAKGFTVIADVN